MATRGRFSMNSRSSQRTNNAGMLNRLALYHDRQKTEQARLRELEIDLKELKRELPEGAALVLDDVLNGDVTFKNARKDVKENTDLEYREKVFFLDALRIASDMKDTRAKITEIEGKIEEFESGGGEEGESISRFSGSVWESLGCDLPPIAHHASQTTSNTIVVGENYNFAPRKVIRLSMEVFKNYCDLEGFIDELHEKSADVEVGRLLNFSTEALFLKSESSIGLCFSQVFQAVLRLLLVEEGDVRLGYTSDFPVTVDLKPDFAVGTITNNQVSIFNTLLVGELKGLASSEGDFYTRWCDLDDPHNRDNCKDSERHRQVSPIRQLYNYMVKSGSFVGVYSTYGYTAAFFRDCEGTLLTTPMLPGESCMREHGLSIPQFLALVTMIALKKEVPLFLDGRGNGILVSCTGSGGCAIHGKSHRDLPEVFKWDSRWVWKQRGGRGDGDGTGAQRNNLLYKEHDTPITWDDLYECKYISDCYTGNAVECEIMGERAVVKYNDFGDHEDADERLDQIDFEAEVYANLSDLQGDCIPKYLGHGSITDTDGLQYGFATSYAGEALSYESLDSLTEEFKTSVKDALDKIHARGVLHGDLRLPNILQSKDDPKKAVFIDFGHSEMTDDPDDPVFQSLAKHEKENLVKLLKGEKIQQVL